MAIYCTNCGKEIEEGVVFCTECGTKAPEAIAAPKAEAPAAEAVRSEVSQAVQAHTPPVQPSAPAAAAPDPKTKVVGTGTFFGLQLLFAIPVIGWLACLIMAFAPKNRNIKHYARANLIWLIIGLVFAVALFFFFQWIGGVIMDYINGMTEGTFGDLGGVFGVGKAKIPIRFL